MASADEVAVIEESSVTAKEYRHRTTIPKGIFERLKLKDKDRLRWILFKDGTLVVSKIEGEING